MASRVRKAKPDPPGDGSFAQQERRQEKEKPRFLFHKRPLVVALGILVVAVVYFFAPSFMKQQPDFVKQEQKAETNTTTTLRSANNNAEAGDHDHDDYQSAKSECTIWVAPSSLKGNPGFGIFTTRDIPKFNEVLDGPDGLSIPIENPDGPDGKYFNDWVNVWENFWYAHGIPDHVTYEGADYVADFQVGLGVLPNHHCLLHSLQDEYAEGAYDDSLVNRFTDPGAGAFSYSNGRAYTVSRSLSAGDEFFLDYGYCKHEHQDKEEEYYPDWSRTIYMTSDFKEAAKIIWDALQQGGKQGLRGSIPLSTPDDKLVADLLPKTTAEWDDIRASVQSLKELPIYLAKHQGLNAHSVEWIQSNGMCLENLKPGKSTIQQAGRGAFARHAIRKGEMVVPAPMMHIVDKAVLTLYDDKDKQNGTQLLINYCFNHAESTLLLCPYSNAALINHCSTSKNECGPEGPNAEYRWSSGWEASSDSWRNLPLEEIAKQPTRGLSFEIIALRDIQVGDEVFIDYGEEWEKAWEKHVANWKPPPPLPKKVPWISVHEANEEGPILDALISGDLRKTVDHPHVFTACQYNVIKSVDGREDYRLKAKWEKWSDDKILDIYSDDGREYGSDVKGIGYTGHGELSYWPCSILKAEEPGKSYTVRIHKHRTKRSIPWERSNTPRILTNYPRDAIHYFVKPYQSDQHLPGVFRHPIGIRDEMFPEQWKNAKKR